MAECGNGWLDEGEQCDCGPPEVQQHSASHSAASLWGKKEQLKASLFFLPLFSFPHRNVTTGAATLPPAGLAAARPALTAAAATTARWASSWERREGLKKKIEVISEVLLLVSSCSSFSSSSSSAQSCRNPMQTIHGHLRPS